MQERLLPSPSGTGWDEQSVDGKLQPMIPVVRLAILTSVVLTDWLRL